jgi:NADPH-dependent curcumin reductase CurA
MHRMEEGLGYLAGLLAEGKLTYKETVVEGIDNFLSAFGLLYSGGNIGKTVLRVADPDL